MELYLREQLPDTGIDSKTRRGIKGRKTGSVDDRYTIIDDEDLDAARENMNANQKQQGMMPEFKELDLSCPRFWRTARP